MSLPQSDFFHETGVHFTLGGFDQFADALGIGLFVAMASERVGAAAGFDEDIRPNHPDFDMDGSNAGNADAHFVLAEQGALVADDGLVRDFNDGGEEKIPSRPATCSKCFRNHAIKF
jgi:hypothetical protein